MASSRAGPSSCSTPSIVPPNNRTYFISYLLPIRRATVLEIDLLSLGPRELGLLLAQERHDSDRGVGAEGGASEVLRLDLDRLVEPEAASAEDRVFDHGDGQRRRPGQLRGQLIDHRLELLRRYGPVHPSD